MIIHKNKKFIEADFDNEQEIENVVISNTEYFFGPSSIFLPKKLIKTTDGAGTIPDGFAIDLASRSWYVVEVELLRHGVWSHIARQVTKQIIAARTPKSRQILEEIVIQMLSKDKDIRDKFTDEGILEINIRKVLGAIFKKPPVIGMPIDKISRDLKDWVEELNSDVKLWLVKKYIEFGNPESIAYEIPEEYRPTLDTTDEDQNLRIGITTFDVSLSDLLESGLLTKEDKLIMTYRPRGGTKKTYKATITEDGGLVVLEKKFKSPSYAALLGIQDAGSNRQTVNGWTSWKSEKGKTLADLRLEYLEKREKEVEQ